MEAKDKYQEMVLNYLEENASDALVEKINSGTKTMQGCWSYIRSEAKKQATNSCACIPDTEVFGWAVHFFEEDSVKESKADRHFNTGEPKKEPKNVAKKEATTDDKYEQIGIDFSALDGEAEEGTENEEEEE